jgi:cysteinyl-tRNA synthetase
VSSVSYAVRGSYVTDVGHAEITSNATGGQSPAAAARQRSFAVAATAQFVGDAREMRLRIYQGADASDPALHPRATEHIPQMLAMIKRLLDGGFAYVDAAGQVYFEISKFAHYGAVGQQLDELKPVEGRGSNESAPTIALWKVIDTS